MYHQTRLLISRNHIKFFTTSTLNPAGISVVNVKTKDEIKPANWDTALPYESIPGPKPLPLIGNIWRFMPYIGEYHNLSLLEMQRKLKKQYGKIVKFTVVNVPRDMILVYDPADMEMMMRNEGTWPLRQILESFVYYRTVTRKEELKNLTGAITLQGEEWFKFRSLVNPILMQPKVVGQYVGDIDIVTTKLLNNMKYFAKINPNNEMPEDFMNEIYKWSFESIGVIALDHHFGCLDLNQAKDSEGQLFINNITKAFKIMYKLDFLPSMWRTFSTPMWKEYVKTLDTILALSRKYVDIALDRIATGSELQPKELSMLQQLLKRDRNAAISMGMDSLLAGIDTTGKSLASTLYFLASNPEKQQILREELIKTLPDKSMPITNETLSNSPYLKAVIKESMRIAPIGVSNIRTTVKEIVLGGYRIPKGVDINTCNLVATMSEENFKDPEKFIPERWLRNTTGELSFKNANPFVYLPFGFGPRSCLGKRLAMLEMEVALSKIVRNLELTWHHGEMTYNAEMIYGIAKPLQIRVTSVNV